MLICNKKDHHKCGKCPHSIPHKSLVDHLDENTNEEIRCEEGEEYCGWIEEDAICIEIEEA